MSDEDDFIPGVSVSNPKPKKQKSKKREELPILDKVPKNDKMALIKFDGTAITEQGNVVRHNWFKGLELNSGAYSDIVLTPEEARGLRTAHQRMKAGASIKSVLICWGDICPRAIQCPYLALQREIDKSGEERRVVPLGKPCPVEADLFHHAVEKLALEFDIGGEEGEYTDQRLILELAEIEVIESRINDKLSSDPELQGLTEEKLIMVTEKADGDRQENYIKGIADLFYIKEKLWARKDKIRKELLGTRREKKLIEIRENNISEVQDASQHMSEVMTRIRQLQAQVKKS